MARMSDNQYGNGPVRPYSGYNQDDIYSRPRNRNSRQDDPYNGQLPYGYPDDIYRGSTETGYNTHPKAPSVEYELDHLATFSISAKQNLLTPRDGMRRLRQMETSSGIWTMRVGLIVTQKEIVIKEKASGKELECFPISRISDPKHMISSDSKNVYNNIVIFSVQGDPSARTQAEMNVFQCIGKSGQELVDDLTAARSGKFPRHVSPKEPNGRAPSQASVHTDDSESTLEDDVNMLNRCFDSIESFVASLQQAANAQKELQRRITKGKVEPKEEEFLRQRSQPPPTKEFVDTFQKFKLALNLLPKLKHMLKDPNAQELTHYLFSPLALVVDASRDSSGRPKLAQSIVSPLLNMKTCELLGNCLHSAEMELWHNLGDSWNIPSEKWVGTLVPPYVPKFVDRSKMPHTPDLPSNANSGGASDMNGHAAPNSGDKQLVQPQSVMSPQGAFLNSLKAKGAKVCKVKVTRLADPSKAKELKVQAGEYVEVIEDVKNWWKVSNVHSQAGFVPKTILEPVQ